MDRRVNSRVREVPRVVVKDATGLHDIDFDIRDGGRSAVIRSGLSKEDWFRIGLQCGLMRPSRRRNGRAEPSVAVIRNVRKAGVIVPLRESVS